MKIATVHPQSPNGNSGVVPPWLLSSPVVPLPGPVDDDFHTLPYPSPRLDEPVVLRAVSLLP